MTARPKESDSGPQSGAARLEHEDLPQAGRRLGTGGLDRGPQAVVHHPEGVHPGVAVDGDAVQFPGAWSK
ncbi:hypothetical protein [Streptomyces clavuligerus]|uniref:hypothetical protein n=1 Tax=Streptomyces clavuligerus TaxID=1901 RepID=UPI001E4B85D7|nr:hypothetical protein [Streptomyces clavuligerus]